MKYLISVLLLVIALSSSAQKIRFIDTRNEWKTLAFVSDGPPYKVEFAYDADTIAYGHVYKLIHRNAFYFYCTTVWSSGTCPGGSGGGSELYLIREDTLNNKVYYRDISIASTDTLEHVLYNYNLTVGDSINFTFMGSTLTDTVASIDSTIINGVYHKIFNMINKQYGFMRSYTVVEGIGCTNNPLFPALFGVCFEYGESLYCFSQSGIRPVIHAPINSCATFTTICCHITLTSFDNTTSCATALSSENTISKNVITATPNPVNGFLNITSDQPFDNNSILSINDLTGTSIYHTQLTEQQHSITINTNGWHTGVYLLTIQNNTGILKKEKLNILR